MRILVISDTHQSHRYINKLLTHCERLKPELIIHLGDDFLDGEAFIENDYQILQIPGTWCPQYENTLIDNRRLETIKGWTLFLTHTPTPHYKDLKDDINPLNIITKEACDLFLHGHTHKPTIVKKGDVTIINPGHCKEKDNRGFPPTFGLLTLSRNKANIQLIKLEDGSILNEKELSKKINQKHE